jgi:hypothetical protein
MPDFHGVKNEARGEIDEARHWRIPQGSSKGQVVF